jgi:hypothetical protein
MASASARSLCVPNPLAMRIRLRRRPISLCIPRGYGQYVRQGQRPIGQDGLIAIRRVTGYSLDYLLCGDRSGLTRVQIQGLRAAEKELAAQGGVRRGRPPQAASARRAARI